jgi:Protein of unknown function (DUF1569)
MSPTNTRRDVSFSHLEEVVTDAERLLSSTRTIVVGNWPLPQLLTHLAMTFNNSIDGFPTKAPIFIRLLGPLIKRSVLKAPKMKPGIKLPKATIAAAFPRANSPQAALDSLRKAIARTKHERMEARHPAFGKMTHDEWHTLHLRHCELHLSFAIPGEPT